MLYSPHTPITTAPPEGQFKRKLLSSAGLSPWPHFVSPGRQQMFTNSHLAQKIVTMGMNERYCQTGMEYEFGRATFSVKMPCDGKILQVIRRYPEGVAADAIKENPETIVIFEDNATKEVGMLTLPRYFSYHSYFGFPYREGKGASQLQVGAVIPKDTIFLDSPGKNPATGNYAYGVELNVAFLSHPAISEDGIVISRDKLHLFRFKRYETRAVEWGEKTFALNVFGQKDGEYKICPDIGEYVRPDGLLMAFRTYDEKLAPVNMCVNALKRIDYAHDERVYANGPGGKVIDIRVTTNFDITQGLSDMDRQMEKYINQRRAYFEQIIRMYDQLRRNKALQLSRPLHALIVKAYTELASGKQRLGKLYRKTPLDHFRVEFVIEYEITPSIGFKYTDTFGGKGVICHIEEPENMPVDAQGVRADMIMGAEARTNRMNIGGLYEHYFNAASRQVCFNVRDWLGLTKETRGAKEAIEMIHQTDPARFDKVWNHVIGYYRIVAPMQAYFYDSGKIGMDGVYENLATIVNDMVYLFLPPDYAVDYVNAILQIEEHVKPIYGPVRYTGYSGRSCMTKRPVRIGSMYIMLLEKTADDWSSVASARVQHFGFLAQIGKTDKYSEPLRQQPIKAVGETEGRILMAYCGAATMAEVMDRNNNPAVHKEMVYRILNAAKPTAINNIVDRNKFQLGKSKPIQMLHHLLNCAGIGLAYTKENTTD